MRREGKLKLIDDIVGRLVRRHSTAAVLFHHAIAERLGLGPTDHKCLDLLRERGSMIGSELAGITGLTSGAITGVVARLEESGYLRREPDPTDGRQQILYPKTEQIGKLHEVFGPIQRDVAALLEDFDAHQLTAIAEFLARSTEFAYTHMAVLRARTVSDGTQGIATAKAATQGAKGRSRQQDPPAGAQTNSKTIAVKVQR